MRRVLIPFTWLLFAATMYVVLTEAVRHWIDLPSPGNIGFTIIFVLFSLFHSAALAGWKRTGVLFAISAVVSYLFEAAGVRTGLVYGHYHYGDQLGAKLGDVPILIPLAWFMMIYPSWMVARAILRGLDVRSPAGVASQACIAALVMTGWDTVMDPGMAASGNWTWEQGGSYFGVPLHNYLGWFLTTLVVYLAWGVFSERQRRAGDIAMGFVTLPVLVYGFYAFSYIMPRSLPALQLVAVFAMGIPALLALLRISLKETVPVG